MILSLYFYHFRDICIFLCIVPKICNLPINTLHFWWQRYYFISYYFAFQSISFFTKQNNHSNIKPWSLFIWNLLIEVRKRGAHLYRFYFNGQNWKLTQFYKTCVLASKAATSALQPAHWTLWTGPWWLLRWTESSLHPGNTGGHAVLAPVHCRTGASCRSVGWEV